MNSLSDQTRQSWTERTEAVPAPAAAATHSDQPIRTSPPATSTFITGGDRALGTVRYIGLQRMGGHDPWQSAAKPCAPEPPNWAASVDLTASSPAIRIWAICAGSRRVGYPIRAQRSADDTLRGDHADLGRYLR